ncbi:MAG: GTPase HflX [Phycisphaerales bacterium]|nr:GTPase HflX [Phycisphaerales bacterium]
MEQDKRTQLSVRAEKAILVGVTFNGADSSADPQDPLGELASLAKTAGADVVYRVMQNRVKIDPSTFIGEGKAQEIKKLVKQHDADVVIFDHDMSPNQLRDLEKIIDAKILDRSELILDIFATRARTHEAQLQVGLAQLEYTYPRLRHMWSHLERIAAGAGAGVGARGPGEMQLEIDRRIVRERVADFKKRIADVQARKTREVQERKRQHFTISLVGYTNAGKSTLFNILTGANTFVEDKLFATLDTKTRRWHLGGAHSALISDTVGFVRDLPHHLVASFKATLEEATHADMLLLVLDISHPHAQQQLKTVVQTLIDIGCENLPTLLVLNKIDALTEKPEARSQEPEEAIENQKSKMGRGENPDALAFWRSLFPDALPASAREGDGIVALTELVRDQMLGRTLTATIAVPLTDSKGTTFIEKFTTVLDRDYDSAPGCVQLHVEISQRILDQLPNNVPSAKVLHAKIKKADPGGGGTWRCRTKPIKELIPAKLFGAPLV